jgi:hypothetical protein
VRIAVVTSRLAEVSNFEQTHHGSSPSIMRWGGAMTCKRCASDKQSVFNGEIAIHFCGLEGLDKPIVWVFPKLVVCLHCGFTEFTVPERELQVLEQGSPVKGAGGEGVSRASRERITFPSPGNV